MIELCVVESNSLIPGPEMTDTASLLDFVWLWGSGLQNKVVKTGFTK